MNRVLHPLRPVRGIIEFLGGLTILLTDAFVTIPAALLSKRGRRLGWSNLWFSCYHYYLRLSCLLYSIQCL